MCHAYSEALTRLSAWDRVPSLLLSMRDLPTFDPSNLAATSTLLPSPTATTFAGLLNRASRAPPPDSLLLPSTTASYPAVPLSDRVGGDATERLRAWILAEFGHLGREGIRMHDQRRELEDKGYELRPWNEKRSGGQGAVKQASSTRENEDAGTATRD